MLRSRTKTLRHCTDVVSITYSLCEFQFLQLRDKPYKRWPFSYRPSPPKMAECGGSSFEEELEWCIRQLELGLSPPTSSVQKKETEQNLKKLRSSKTPFPRKRQLMQSIFGDYRSKMADEPRQTSAKIEKIKQDTIKETAIFKKKKATNACTESSNFKFNFDVS